MDEMRIKLCSKFMRGVVSKLMSKVIYKKTGCRVNIRIDELDIWNIDGETTANLNIRAKMKSCEFNKIIQKIDLKDEES